LAIDAGGGQRRHPPYSQRRSVRQCARGSDRARASSLWPEDDEPGRPWSSTS